MAEKSVADRVKEIIVEQLGVNADQVTPEAKFIEDLGADSLDTVELVMAFVEAFEVEIPDEDPVRHLDRRDLRDGVLEWELAGGPPVPRRHRLGPNSGGVSRLERDEPAPALGVAGQEVGGPVVVEVP